MEWFYFAFLSMVLIVVKNIAEKLVLNKDSEIQFLTVFYLFSAVLALPLLFFVNISLSPFELGLMLLIGFISLFSIYYSISAIKHLELSYAKPMGSLAPIVVLFFAFVFLGESVSALQLAGSLLVLIVSFIFIKEESGILKISIPELLKSKYMVYIFVAIIMGSFSSLLDRVLLRSVEPVEFLVVSRFIVFFGFFFLALIKFDGVREVMKGMKSSWKPILLITVLNFGLAFFYYLALADPSGKVGLVSVIRNSSVVFTILLSGHILKEQKIAKKIFLGVLLLAGLSLIVLGG